MDISLLISALQFRVYGEREIQDNYRHPIRREHAGDVLQFVPIGQNDLERGMFPTNTVHMRHARTDSHLLLVRKRSEAKGANKMYFLENSIIPYISTIYDLLFVL